MEKGKMVVLQDSNDLADKFGAYHHCAYIKIRSFNNDGVDEEKKKKGTSPIRGAFFSFFFFKFGASPGLLF